MRHGKLFSTLLLLVFLAGFTTQASAQFTTPSWSTAPGGGCNGGELSFSPITASSLVSIDNPGSGYGHSSNPTGTYELEVRAGSVWVSIYSVDVGSTVGNVPLSSIPTPISFSPMTFDGFRLRGNPPDSCSFHGLNAAMTFTFGATTVPVPSLSDTGRLSFILLLLATGIFAGRRWLA